MCFALPLQVVSAHKNQAKMEDGRTVNLSLVKSAKRGEWLLVQSNLAVDKLALREARVMRQAIKEAALDSAGGVR